MIQSINNQYKYMRVTSICFVPVIIEKLNETIIIQMYLQFIHFKVSKFTPVRTVSFAVFSNHWVIK